MNFNDIKFRIAEKSDINDIMEIEQSSFSKIICEDENVFLQRIETFNKGFIVWNTTMKLLAIHARRYGSIVKKFIRINSHLDI